MDDPYPIYTRIRDTASAVWVESANIHLVTRFDDIQTIERDSETYASTNPQSLMNFVMGHSLMRKDGEPHKLERAAIEPSFRPGVVKNHWAPIFAEISTKLIDGFIADGKTDLFDSFAAPMASLALAEMLGINDVDWRELADWSQSLMDGVANYGNDPDIAARAKKASSAVDVAIDAVLSQHSETQNPTILSSMLHAESPHTIEQIRANVKVIIGGGLNEPRDSMLSCIYGLLQNPDQIASAQENPKFFASAFEESVRWISPIGMYPRRVTKDTILGDTALKEGDQLGICVGAANHDPSKFKDADKFDANRPRQQHLAFGSGSHFCAGTWVARLMVGQVAVPEIFERLDGLRLQSDNPPILRGWVFRGPTKMPVEWNT